MSKVYELKQDTENYANFVEQWDKLENSFAYKYMKRILINLDEYQSIKLKLYASDIGKKIIKQILLILQVVYMFLVKELLVI